MPAMKIGRLATDDRHRAKGLGKFMINYSIYIAEQISKNAACRFITLDAMRSEHENSNLVDYYKKYNFQVLELKNPRKDTIPMYLDLHINS